MTVRNRVPTSLRPMARHTLDTFGAATSRFRTTPDFIVIGGQRCGTTTIFKTLAQHPQVLRPLTDKGTDYFTLHYSRGLAWYRGRMPLEASRRARRRRQGDAKVFEACTYYMFHPVAIERLAQALPNVKLVAMLRNPVSRAFSAYKHELARGFETEPSFRRALDLEDERLDGEVERLRNDPDYQSFSHRHHAYRRRGQFAEQLERVFAHFPKDQVHVMQSESFFADPGGEFTALTDFLGLRRWLPDHFDRHNARPSSPMPDDAREFLATHYKAHDAALAELLGAPPTWL